MNSNKLIIDNNFKQWVIELSNKYKKSQIKAAIKVNSEMIKFYFELGKEIYSSSFKAKYGSKFYECLSKELTSNLNNIRGLSPKNLRYMENFYILYKDDISIFPQLVGQLYLIPWGHHRIIIDKCKTAKEAIFYVKKTIDNNWSREVLNHFLKTELFSRNGKAINNFDVSLPDTNKDLANQIIKDPYNFDFLSISEDFNEKQLKAALIDNISKFLLELGTGFAFVGRESRLLVGDTELYTDLLFYNTSLHAYVVIEVKVSKFKPADLGQLSGYVSSINHLLKQDVDNPTIGILICQDKDEIVAQYSLECYNIPIGISSYEVNERIVKDFKNTLPTIDEIKRNLKS